MTINEANNIADLFWIARLLVTNEFTENPQSSCYLVHEVHTTSVDDPMRWIIHHLPERISAAVRLATGWLTQAQGKSTAGRVCSDAFMCRCWCSGILWWINFSRNRANLRKLPFIQQMYAMYGEQRGQFHSLFRTPLVGCA